MDNQLPNLYAGLSFRWKDGGWRKLFYFLGHSGQRHVSVLSAHAAIAVPCDCIVDILSNADLTAHSLECMAEAMRGAGRALEAYDGPQIDAPGLAPIRPVEARWARFKLGKQLSILR